MVVVIIFTSNKYLSSDQQSKALAPSHNHTAEVAGYVEPFVIFTKDFSGEITNNFVPVGHSLNSCDDSSTEDLCLYVLWKNA